MGCFSWLKKKKKPKEVVRNYLEDEIIDTKEKKKRRWWQRGFMRNFLCCSSSSTSSSSSSSSTFSFSSSSFTSSSFSSYPALSSLDSFTYRIPTLGRVRLGLSRRCFSSSLISSSPWPPPLNRSSSAPILSHLSTTSCPLLSSSLYFSLTDVSEYFTDYFKAQRSSPSGLDDEISLVQINTGTWTAPGTDDNVQMFSRSLESPLSVQVQYDPHAQSESVYDQELSVFKRHCVLKSNEVVQGHSLADVKRLGLPSILNTCFMNATLQCLLGLSCFWTPIRDQQDSWTDTSDDSQMLRCLAELQQARFSSSSSSSSNTRQKKKILKALKKCLTTRCPEFGDYSQQDAHEFLMLCLLQLKEEGEALRASNPSYICPVANFEFQLKSVLTCTSCGLQRSRVEDFNHLSINLNSTLTGSLHSYFQETDLDYFCECEQGIRATEVQEFSTLPRVLILHVKRFNMMGSRKKLKGAMIIPAQLDLSDFPGVASPGQARGSLFVQSSPRPATKKLKAKSLGNCSFKPAVARGEGQGERGQQRSSLEPPPRGVYRLHSIVSHLGHRVNSGHYISDVAQEEGDGWLSFNDREVSHVTEKTVLNSSAKTAYLLFYVHSGAERQTVTNVKRLEKADQARLTCTLTAVEV